MPDSEREKRIYELLQQKQLSGGSMSGKEARILELMDKKYAAPASAQKVPPSELQQEGTTFVQRIGFGEPEQRTLFGLPKGAESVVAPRYSQLPPDQKETMKGTMAGLKDVASLPGRALSSLPSALGFRGGLGNQFEFHGKPADAIKDIEGQSLPGKLLKDPSLPLSIAAGAGASQLIPRAGGVLAKLGAGIGAGALEGALTGTARQTGKALEGKDVSGKELLGEVVGSAAFGGLSELGGALLKYKAAPELYRSAMKPVKSTRRAGFDPQNIVKYDVDGSFKTISKKSDNLISQAKKQADDYLETFAQQNPDAKVNIDDVIQDFLEDLDSGNLDKYFAADQIEAAEGAANKIIESFNKRGYTGDIALPDANKAKRWLSKGIFKKGPSPTIEESAAAKVKELIDLKMRDKIQDIAPEISKYNQVMRDLIPVRLAAEEAVERVGNKNNILGMTNLAIGSGALGGGLATGDIKKAALALPLMGGIQFLSPGRGAALTRRAGDAISGLGQVGGRSYLGGNVGTRIVNPDEEEEKRKAQQRMSAQFGGQ